MKILLDECVPHRLAGLFEGHDVRTTSEMGWASVKNGQLLSLAASAFDLMITVDKRMANEQDETKLRLPVVILAARSTQFKHLAPLVPNLLNQIEKLTDAKFHFIRG